MGQTIHSVTDKVSYAGELRRAARQADTAETAKKIQSTAAALEKTALRQVGKAGPGIGALLDTFA
jgi:hypothetical protein